MSGDLTKLLSETMAKLIEHTDAVLIIVVKDGNVGSSVRGPLELCVPLYAELGSRIVVAVSKAVERRMAGDACNDPTCPMHGKNPFLNN
jgi:hypothetical protein